MISITANASKAQLEAVAQTLANRCGKKPKPSGDGFTTNCPCADHADENGSLTLSLDNGKLLWCCQKGCTQEAVTIAIKPYLPATAKKRTEEKVYQYHNASGNLILEKVRYIPKSFAIRQPNSNGYIWNSKGVDTSIIYNLPAVLQAIAVGKPVLIVEGEKDADNLIALGLVATCNIFGASENGKKPKWTVKNAAWLKGAKEIIIFFDNDDAGRAHARAIAQSLLKLNIPCKIILLPGLAAKEDVSDWLNKGGTKKELLQLIDDTPFCSDEQLKANFISNEVTEVTEVTRTESVTQSILQETPSVTSAGNSEVTEVAKQIFWSEGYFQLQKSGVYYIIPAEEEKPEQKIWICSPLEIRAVTRDEDGSNWGSLLVFRDSDNREHQWAMPSELFKGSGDEFRGELLYQGLKIAPGKKARDLLPIYIQISEPDLKARCVNKTGWYENKFVLPNGIVIGEQSSELLLLQTIKVIQHGIKNKGTLNAWRETVSKYCQGNTRLLFAVALAFAAVLLELLGEESGGFNLRGPSSIGKTTILYILASVFGSKDYVKSCRATINGAEGVAAAYNNLALPLDEIGQLNPHEATEFGYMLANGKGKSRANKLGEARAALAWKILFLLSGEKTLAEHMSKAGLKTTAGVEVRVPDINANTGKYGAFENLHGFKDGVEFVGELKRAAAANHGTAGIAFIERICLESADELQSQWREFFNHFFLEYVPNGASEQVKRVAQRFALVAFGGELATEYGLTGWQEGEVLKASAELFKLWLQERGGAQEHERTALLEQVNLFFERDGQSRFEDDKDAARIIINRAGRRVVSPDRIDYYVSTEVFHQEVIKGHNRNYAISILRENEDIQLIPDVPDPKKNQVNMRIGGITRRCYHIRIKAVTERSAA